MCAANRLIWLALIAGLTLELPFTFAQSELAGTRMTLSALVHERTPSMSQESKPTPTVIPDAKDEEEPSTADYLKMATEFLEAGAKMDNAPIVWMVASAFKNERRAKIAESRLAALESKPLPSEPEEVELRLAANCMDCGLDYDWHGCDIHLPLSDWRRIVPDGVGLLCGMCIARRVNRLRGVTGLTAYINHGATECDANIDELLTARRALENLCRQIGGSDRWQQTLETQLAIAKKDLEGLVGREAWSEKMKVLLAKWLGGDDET
jgi:hypothetical protein